MIPLIHDEEQPKGHISKHLPYRQTHGECSESGWNFD
jgi:hypothetical protein